MIATPHSNVFAAILPLAALRDWQLYLSSHN